MTSSTPSAPRRPPLFVRLFTAPLSAGAIQRRARRTAGPLTRRLGLIALLLLVPALGVAGFELWSRRAPMLEPRHRAEALCFVLAQPPAFAPPMRVEPSAAQVRGRFAPSTPPELAVQELMHFSDPMIVRQWRRQVGDYAVSLMWLRLPEAEGVRHWLIVAWMEASDLEVCSFRFGDDSPTLTEDETLWGNRLLQRILSPAYFDAARLPAVRLRAEHGATMPAFGPPPQG